MANFYCTKILDMGWIGMLTMTVYFAAALMLFMHLFFLIPITLASGCVLALHWKIINKPKKEMKGWCIDLFSVVCLHCNYTFAFQTSRWIGAVFWGYFLFGIWERKSEKVKCCVLIKNILSSCSHIQDTSLRPYCERLVWMVKLYALRVKCSVVKELMQVGLMLWIKGSRTLL